ncbi:MAG TPA: methyltransferase, partial [Candidatus Nanoarchaeia archaeon]|nr:methyltransferase [Candidatus Nanoarchaeia archaeon]
MPTPFSLYEPREDSYLLAAQVAKYARGKVLDMGIGSGIQASTAAKQRKVKTVLAVDLQSGVIAHCRKTLDSKKIRFRVSDLFARIPEKFDTVIFN